jgi:hypothetical protein
VRFKRFATSDCRDLAHLESEHDVLGHGEVREQRIALEHHRDVAPRRGKAGHVAPVDQDAAGVSDLEPGNEPQRRRLAAAGGAEQHVEGSALERKREPVDRAHIPVGGRPMLGYALGDDGRHERAPV